MAKGIIGTIQDKLSKRKEIAANAEKKFSELITKIGNTRRAFAAYDVVAREALTIVKKMEKNFVNKSKTTDAKKIQKLEDEENKLKGNLKEKIEKMLDEKNKFAEECDNLKSHAEAIGIIQQKQQ